MKLIKMKKKYKSAQKKTRQKAELTTAKSREKDQNSPSPLILSRQKKVVFSVFAILLPVIFFGLLEIGLIAFNYGGNPDLFISNTGDVSHYWMCNRDVGKRYFFMQATTPVPSKDLFLKEKPANGFRIFILGGSTAAGFPYGNNLMFSRILFHKLRDTFPNKHIEVVNTSMSAINSYTLLDFTDEILEKQPDAILIYAGHNEFYGALGVGSLESLGRSRWFIRSYLKLKRFRTFLLLRDFMGWLRKLTGSASADQLQQSDQTATLMERIAAEQEIPYKSHLYELGLNQFKSNLSEIVQTCRNAGVSVILSELVSNIRDQAPFSSLATDSIPPANTFFQKARQNELQQNFSQAYDLYHRAKDLDAIRFRATEDFNAIIHSIAATHNVPVAPMKTYFEMASPNRLVGNNIMVDHLHPNIKGYFLMAEAFYNTMHEEKMIQSRWDSTYMKSAEYYYHNWGITQLDTLNADYRVLYLKNSWPFVKDHRPNTTLQQIHPQTKAESMALQILINPNLSLESGHLEMAEYYEKQGDLVRAYNEYKALFYTIPFEVMFYNRAASLLMRMNRHDEALPLLQRSIEINDNAFANKWYGQMLLMNKRIAEAIPYLEKARITEPKDEQMLFNLCQAYLILRNREKAREIFDQLKKYFPTSSYLTKLSRMARQKPPVN
jgi:lysophospholipase L1-like esterase